MVQKDGDDPTLRFVRADYGALPPYAPIQPLDILAAELGLPIERLAKLDANENLYGPMPEVQEALHDLEGMHIYPDPAQTKLRADLAEYIGCSPDNVVAGVGSDEILDLLIRLMDQNSGIVTATPTFGMYAFLGKIAGSRIVDVPRKGAPDFELDMDGMVAAVEEGGAKLVFVASPNNPTGGLISEEQVRRLCATNAILVVDEAYAEFSGGSAVGLLNEFPNLVVLRTFSKWAGLAGMRVGFSIAHPKLTEKLLSIKQPYNINVAAEVSARAALAVRDKIREQHILPILKERERMLVMLQEFEPLEPMPSVANYVLFRVNEPWEASKVYSQLRRLGVLVRYYSSSVLAGFVRISCGRPQDTDLLVAALRQLVSEGALLSEKARAAAAARAGPAVPQALLLDMDGVLAEVSMSYRQAIVDTAACFGVTVTGADIHAAKLAGNANDDWKLTHKLVSDSWSSSGKAAPTLEQVTEKFQEFYLGLDGKPGLRDLETLLPSRALLVELRKRCPLGMGIVTGRPRQEALHFLDMFKLRALVSNGEGQPIMVCMHEAPSKPSPEPLLLALERLGTGATPEQTVFVGDTVDDMRAAVSAGARGFGVLTPHGESMENALYDAGAESVMKPGFVELLEVFAPTVAGPSASSFSAVSQAPTMGAPCKSARQATVERKTKETCIMVRVNLDGTGASDVNTGLGFLDHMISAMSKHSRIDITAFCKGDLWIDDHHTAEDVGIALGEAVDAALGARKGITRWGYAHCPLDEALSSAVVDVSSRPWAVVDLSLKREMIGTISSEMLEHFLVSFVTGARLTVHVKSIVGDNDHHKSESAFKALGVALRMAFKPDSSAGIPSTKGFLA